MESRSEKRMMPGQSIAIHFNMDRYLLPGLFAAKGVDIVMKKEELAIKARELEKNVSESEKAMLSFMSRQEKTAYFESKARMKIFEAEVKKKRDAAVKKQKAEQVFWQQVRDRRDEILAFYASEDAAETAESEVSSAYKIADDAEIEAEDTIGAPVIDSISNNAAW